MNLHTISGRLGKDPVIKTLDNDTKVARFAVATSTYKKKGGETVTETDWHNVSAFRYQADLAEKFLHKGSHVVLWGRHRISQYEKDGVMREYHEIIAEKIEMLDKREDSPKKNDEFPF